MIIASYLLYHSEPMTIASYLVYHSEPMIIASYLGIKASVHLPHVILADL